MRKTEGFCVMKWLVLSASLLIKTELNPYGE